MGKQIVYCGGCGRSLYEDDFARGKAHTVDNRPFCAGCRPLSGPPPSSTSLKALPWASESSSGKHASARKTARIPVVPTPSTTRRIHAPSQPSRSKTPFLVGGSLAAIALVVLLVFAVAGGSSPPPPSVTEAPPPPIAPAPAERAVPRAATPRPAPAPAADPASAVKDLEAFAASSSDPDAILQRCDEVRAAVRGTPSEARLRAIEEAAREQKKSRDRDRQVTSSIEQARRIIQSQHLAERKEEVQGLLRAARDIAGPRREEVERVLADMEKRLKEPAPPPAPPPEPMAVTGVTLMNAESDLPIAGFDPMPAWTVLNLAALPTRQLNVRANTTPGTLGSVKFEMNGAVFGVEDEGPYALARDSAGDYWPWTPAPGTYTLTVTPYAGPKAAGAAGTPVTVTFEVVDPVAAGGRPTVSFQDGVSPTPAYEGTRDAMIFEGAPDKNHGASTACRVSADDPPGQKKQRCTLLKWDLASIPPGSVVQSASLTLVGTDRSYAFDLFEMKRPWVERQVTWNESAQGKPWETPGAKGRQDCGSVSLGQVKFKTANTSAAFELNAAAVAAVQSWVDDPSTNFGFMIAGDKKDDLDFASREHVSAASRPKLTVVFSKGTGTAAKAAAGAHELEVTGLITQWLALGPFGNRKDPDGMWDHDLLGTEQGHVPAPGLEVATREGTRVRWTAASAPEGDLLFNKIEPWGLSGRTREPAIAFAACWLEAEAETKVKFRVNADHGFKIWHDHAPGGNRVGAFPLSGNPETYTRTLNAGRNLFLVKVSSIGDGFGLRVRVTTLQDPRVRAPGVRVWTGAPGSATVAAPARKVLFADDFDRSPVKFQNGTVVDGGVNGSKGYAFTKSAHFERRFAINPSVTVRFKIKPLFEVKGLCVIMFVPKVNDNCWYHVRNAKKDQWTAVEYRAADARVGWRMDGASPEGGTAENLKIYFDPGAAAGTVLIDDFEIFEEGK